jgi:adenine-specific DNA-methyltransferase
MIYPRLKVARDLLSNDGVIFISMDDNEQRNLKNICDEIFGECNFIATIIWQKIHSIKNDAKYFSENHEYALVYARDISSFSLGLLPRTEEMNNRYKNPDNDPRGPWQSGDLVASGERSNGHFIVTSPTSGKQFDVPNGKHWVYSQSNLEELVKDNQIWFGSDGTSFPRKKRFLKDVQDGRTPSTIWLSEEVGHNQTATREVNALLNGKYFDFPKPVDYIEQMLRVANTANSIVLDFFSGSATTAHAVMKLNAEDGGNRKFIMVQLPEVTDTESEARKAGYNTICEIGKERIRRAGRKIKEEAGLQGQDLDIGFRVLKLAESNMENVFYSPDKLDAKDLFTLEDNVKTDRTAEDLLFQVMLDLGVELSSPIEKKSINGVDVFNVKDGFLIATFDKDVNESTITEIAKSEPVYFVMRDASAANDNVLDNFDQLFRHYSPDTIRRIL